MFGGLEMIDDTHLMKTDWQGTNRENGRLLFYNLEDHRSNTYPTGSGPADIGYDKQKKSFIYRPCLKMNYSWKNFPGYMGINFKS